MFISHVFVHTDALHDRTWARSEGESYSSIYTTLLIPHPLMLYNSALHVLLQASELVDILQVAVQANGSKPGGALVDTLRYLTALWDVNYQVVRVL